MPPTLRALKISAIVIWSGVCFLALRKELTRKHRTGVERATMPRPYDVREEEARKWEKGRQWIRDEYDRSFGRR